MPASTGLWLSSEKHMKMRWNIWTINEFVLTEGEIRQKLEKKWDYNKDVCPLFIDFENSYDSIKRESLYDIVIKFGVPKTLVRLIKPCLDGTQSKVRIGNYLSSSFPIYITWISREKFESEPGFELRPPDL